MINKDTNKDVKDGSRKATISRTGRIFFYKPLPSTACLGSADAKSAFLQADNREEGWRLWTRGVPELARSLGVPEARLFRIMGAVYSLQFDCWNLHSVGLLIMKCQWRAIPTAPQYSARVGMCTSALKDNCLRNLRGHFDSKSAKEDFDSRTSSRRQETSRSASSTSHFLGSLRSRHSLANACQRDALLLCEDDVVMLNPSVAHLLEHQGL